MLFEVIMMFEICCFWMTMAIWVVSSLSNSQAKSLARDTHRKRWKGKVLKTNVVVSDSGI